MKTYQIIVRSSTVVFTLNIMCGSNKKARRYAAKQYPGFSIYRMWRVG